MWLKLYGSVMYCELCELLTLPDQIPGSPLMPQILRPFIQFHRRRERHNCDADHPLAAGTKAILHHPRK